MYKIKALPLKNWENIEKKLKINIMLVLVLSLFSSAIGKNHQLYSLQKSHFKTVIKQKSKRLPLTRYTMAKHQNSPAQILNAKTPHSILPESSSYSSNAIIGGIAKHIEKHEDRFTYNLDNLRKQFKHTTTIIVIDTNDDNTENILDDYAKNHPDTYIVKIKNPGKHRTEKMAYARNVFIDEASKYFDDNPYLISFDFDIYEIHAETINNALAHQEDWDVATVNPLKIYYDKWALRTEADNVSCWGTTSHPGYRCAESLSHWFPNSKLGDGIPPEQEPLEVLSAFGGLGIYKTKTIKKCRSKPGGCLYVGENSEGNGDCEHVAFHKSLREKADAKIYIWPSMTMWHVKQKSHHN